MKKIILLVSILILSASHAQNKPKQKTITIVDGKIKNIDRNSKDYKPLDSDNTLIIRILKDSVDYNKTIFKAPFIVVVTKPYVLEEFYKIALEKDPTLKNNIPSADYLLKIGVISSNTKGIINPYGQFYKYVYTNDLKVTMRKIGSIVYIEPENAVKLNPKWIYGAIKIIDSPS